LDARAAQNVDVAADRTQPAAHMGAVEHDVAVDVPDGAAHLCPAAELDLPVDRLDAATHAHGLPEGYRPVHCVHGAGTGVCPELDRAVDVAHLLHHRTLAHLHRTVDGPDRTAVLTGGHAHRAIDRLAAPAAGGHIPVGVAIAAAGQGY